MTDDVHRAGQAGTCKGCWQAANNPSANTEAITMSQMNEQQTYAVDDGQARGATAGGAMNRVTPLEELGGASTRANEPGVHGAPGHTVTPLSELGGATTRANESRIPGGTITPLSELGGATTRANESRVPDREP
jgi:hypothetical protein